MLWLWVCLVDYRHFWLVVWVLNYCFYANVLSSWWLFACISQFRTPSHHYFWSFFCWCFSVLCILFYYFLCIILSCMSLFIIFKIWVFFIILFFKWIELIVLFASSWSLIFSVDVFKHRSVTHLIIEAQSGRILRMLSIGTTHRAFCFRIERTSSDLAHRAVVTTQSRVVIESAGFKIEFLFEVFHQWINRHR